jgi:cell division protein FtsB
MDIRIKFQSGEASTQRVLAIARALYLRRRKLATGGIGVLAMWLGLHVIFGANGMVVYQQKRSEYGSLQVELKQLQQENDRYMHEIQALKSDPQAIEKEAREQLRYARPGEVVYVVPAESRRDLPPTNSARK